MRNYFNLQRMAVLLFGVLCCFKCQQVSETPADLIVIDATIWTGNEGYPFAEAIAVKSDTIMAIGTSEEIKKYAGPETAELNTEGAFITPGFIDTHTHFMSGGYGLSSVKLRDAASPEEFANRLSSHTELVPKGTWIREGDWDHQMWGGELPRADWIDRYTTEHPVFVTRLDGHISLANSLAMKLAGVDKNTPDVPGGSIERDQDGSPTGIFRDNAQNLIFDAIPANTDEQNDKALLDAMKYVVSNGVTTIHNMDLAPVSIIDSYRRIRDQQIVRFYVAVGLSYWQELAELVEREGTGDEWLKIGVLKGMVDGALGSHTAAFFEPFTDTPNDRGFFLLEEDSLYNWISNADKKRLHLAIHAIGDRAINLLLNTFEEVSKENGTRDRRYRIEHAQHLSSEDIGRFSDLDVIASMQPYHAIDDGRWAESVIGSDRIKTTYAFRSLLDAKAKVAFGSDWAVAPPTPLEGIYAAVTRRTIDDANPDGWVPEEKISVQDALKAYTITGAYASFDEDIKGTLEVGKLADFVMIDQNLIEIDPVNIKNAKVLKTYVGGELVFERN